jgi:trigger factor|tara:strand:+ start:1371 stop:2723 length:1353 start_codon:yes stop_codon:yes gene_type:complete
MNISQESNGELTAIIHINLQESDYIDAVNKQLSDYRKKAKMPGFRPGMVPIGMIKKMYGNSVMVDEVNKSLSEGLNNYIIDNKINIIGNPIPNAEKTTKIDFAKQKDFDFYFDIGIAPELSIKLSKEIKVPYYTIKITDTEIDKAIGDVKVRFGEDENPEVAEAGDAFQGKFIEVDSEGNTIEGGIENDGFLKYEDIKLKTTQNKFIGKKAGESIIFNPLKAIKDESKVASLINRHEDGDEKLKSDYKFEIAKVVRIHEAELGEDLYKKVFPAQEIASEEEFTEALSNDLVKHYQRDTDRQFLADTVKELIKIADISLPDEFLKRWLLESNEGKITQEQVDTQYDNYARTFKWQLLEGELLKEHAEDMQVKEEEVREKVAAYFQTMGGGTEITPQIEGIIDQVLSNKEEKQKIFNDIQDEKLIKLFKANITPKNKKVTTEKFIEIASKID